MNPNRRSTAACGIASTGKSGISSGCSSSPRSNGRKRRSSRGICWICTLWWRSQESEDAATIRLAPRRPEAAGAARGIGQIALQPLHRLIARQNHLRDPVPGVDGVRLTPQIQQDHAHFAAIPGVNRPRRVGNRDRVLQRQTATRPHLRFVSRRNLDGETGRHQARRPGFQHDVLHRVQIHAGVLVWSVSVPRQGGLCVGALDSDVHPRYHSVLTPTKRVITVAPMPPEKSAYALARYSRSPDSIRESMEWVRSHNSEKFLESFYFQYGHASIADLGHTVMCFEGISELAATEIEAEPLWDGQAKSSRYQDFSRSGFLTPPELTGEPAVAYQAAGEALLAAYAKVKDLAFAALCERLPRPAVMKPDAYRSEEHTSELQS